MKKKSLLFWGLFLLAGVSSQAQYNSIRNKKWATGQHLGLSFGSSGPSIMSTNLTSFEGSASVCDTNGSLLFYTNGTTLWNAAGNIMPHGDTIYYGPGDNTLSASQAAVIVPFPGNAQRYYVFSLISNLYCHVVDMGLAGGMGDVDTTFALSHTVLADSMTEKMIAIQGCNNNVWVLTHSRNTPRFEAYEITTSGLNTNPVVSNTGNYAAPLYYQGVIKASPSGDRILCCNTSAGTELYDFDPATGIVSNPVILDHVHIYGGCFSPDGRKAYCLNIEAGVLCQYDLDAPNPLQSKINVGSAGVSDVKLAIDGKIYYNSSVNFGAANGTDYMGCINNPDVAGMGCNTVDSAIAFPVIGGQSGLVIGLPNEVVTARIRNTEGPVYGIVDTVVCHFPFATGMLLHAPAGYSRYLWDDGTGSINRTIMQRGTYWVKSVSGCDIFTDTFKVRGTQVPLVLSFSNPVISANSGFASYQWFQGSTLIPGATQSSLNITANGWYSVKVTDAAGCTDSVSIEIAGWTGINDPSLPGWFTVYPTLTHDKVYIRGAKNQVFNLSLSDVSGKTILRRSHSNTLDMNKVSPGMYLLYIEDPVTRQRQYSKIIKE